MSQVYSDTWNAKSKYRAKNEIKELEIRSESQSVESKLIYQVNNKIYGHSKKVVY